MSPNIRHTSYSSYFKKVAEFKKAKHEQAIKYYNHVNSKTNDVVIVENLVKQMTNRLLNKSNSQTEAIAELPDLKNDVEENEAKVFY